MTRWDEAIWGTTRWPALTTGDLIAAAPALDRGQLIGLDDWRLVVEIALPSSNDALWGTAAWDSSQWATFAWADMTSYVRGLEWTRGSDEPYGRPRIGQLDLTVANPDDYWSPYNPDRFPAYFAPGTLIRVGVRSPTSTVGGGWIPQFCGLVDSWPISFAGRGADSFIEITCYETLRDLASIDNNALSSVVGLGEDAGDRIARLMDAADWPYGLEVDAENMRTPADISGGFWTLQSTDMSGNRLAECYLAADSSDVVLRPGRKGNAVLVAPYWFGYFDGPNLDIWTLGQVSWGSYSGDNSGGAPIPAIGFDWYEHRAVSGGGDTLYVPYDADTFQMTNEDAYIVNDIRFARVGGSQIVHEQGASIKRYGRRTYTRSDLQCRYDITVLNNAYRVGRHRGLNTLRVTNIEVATSQRSDDVYLCMLAADIGCEGFIWPPDGVEGLNRPARIRGHIASLRHSVTPKPDGVVWSTVLAIDTENVQGLPSAQLPETPRGDL